MTGATLCRHRTTALAIEAEDGPAACCGSVARVQYHGRGRDEGDNGPIRARLQIHLALAQLALATGAVRAALP